MKNKSILIVTTILLGLGYFYFKNELIKGGVILMCYGFLWYISKIFYFDKHKEEESTINDFTWLFSMIVFLGGILVHSISFWIKDPKAPEFILCTGLSLVLNGLLSVLGWITDLARPTKKENDE